MNLVELTDVSFAYSGSVILEHIFLDIPHGDYVGLIGPNGAGKTTLLKIILGLTPPTSGEVRLFGHDLARFRDWRKIGYVPQRPGAAIAAFPVSVEEMVSLNTASSHAVTQALTDVGLLGERHTLLSQLSGGQQQRAFIARALASHPQLLILDEPTVGVDVVSQARFYDLLKTLNTRHGLTLVLVSHDVDMVAREVKTVVCVNRTLVCHGPTAEIIREGVLEKLYGSNLRLVHHPHPH